MILRSALLLVVCAGGVVGCGENSSPPPNYSEKAPSGVERPFVPPHKNEIQKPYKGPVQPNPRPQRDGDR